MKKRLFAMFLALAMCLALVPVSAFAAGDTLPLIWLPDGIWPVGYSEETGRVIARDRINGYILDKTGAIVSTFTGYDSFTFDESTGWIKVGKDGKFGFIDQTGKVVIPLVYDNCELFSEGLAVVSAGSYPNTKCGFINESGQLVVPMDYDFAVEFSDGLAVIEKNGKWGYVDTTGQTVIPLVYDFALPFYGGVAVVGTGKDESSSKYGLIDTSGRLVLPLKYDELYNDGGEILPAVKDGMLGFIDRTDRVVVPFFTNYGFPGQQFTGYSSVSEGRIALYDRDGKTYYKDMTGKTVGGTYDFGGIFSEGLAYAEQNGKCGFIDTSGNFAFYIDVPAGSTISPVGGVLGPSFNNGIAAITFDKPEETAATGLYQCLCGVVDKQGNVIVPFQYEEARMFDDNCGCVGDGERSAIFFNPNATVTPNESEDKIAVPATPTNDKLSVDGKDATPAAYKIGGANYFKLRDVAMLVNGTKAQFSIDYDGEKKAIVITTGQPYQPLGGELGTVPSAAATAMTSNDAVYINGVKTDLTAYKINNANYYGIRALAKALGFNVDWTSERGMFIETDKPYSGT